MQGSKKGEEVCYQSDHTRGKHLSSSPSLEVLCLWGLIPHSPMAKLC